MTMETQNDFLKERRKFSPITPEILGDFSAVLCTQGNKPEVSSEIKKLFPKSLNQGFVSLQKGHCNHLYPLTVGIVFSGGQAPGGHNVVSGLFDAIKRIHLDSKVIGFLQGPDGIIKGEYRELEKQEIAMYRNTGGFDLIGSGRTKIETKEQLERAAITVKALALDGLVIVGGDDSNTNAAILAEYFLQKSLTTKVIGVPKTIDGDLKNEYIESSFGFDTACKVYGEVIGNIARDAISAKKYYHFIKLMGRSASHIALECALQVQPTLTLISEEIREKKYTLQRVIDELSRLIDQRAKAGKNYGIIVIPEGLIEFIPEINELISLLNQIIAKHGGQASLEERIEIVHRSMPSSLATIFASFPKEIQSQLLLDRDPHGNVQVSKIATEKLLIHLVSLQLQNRAKFVAVDHFFGYEGRCGYPSNFDATYCYALGVFTALLIRDGFTGYMSCIKNLSQDPSQWECFGLPLTTLLHLEERHGTRKPVIQKALVDLKGAPFQHFTQNREKWALEDCFKFPSPIQFFGPSFITNSISLTLKLEQK